MACIDVMSTPNNTMSRESMRVMIRNNVLNNSLEFSPSCDDDMMDTESPVCSRSLQPVSKKLFQSPASPKYSSPKVDREQKISSIRRRKALKRRQNFPESAEKLQKAYIMECEGDTNVTEKKEIRRVVLVSLFHNKEYAMDLA